VQIDAVKEKTTRDTDTLTSTQNAIANGTFSKLDGLIVLPEIKNIYAIYLCLNTDVATFSSAPKKSELKLKYEIFGERELIDCGNHPVFKVSCAACMLEYEPNGFVCISSPSIATVKMVQGMGLKRVQERKSIGDQLHADHAHFLCVLPRRLLWRLETARTRNEKNEACIGLSEEMQKQGLPVKLDLEGLNHHEFGSHIRSLLHITKFDADCDTAYWLTTVFDDTSHKKKLCWNIDLPGGKRHLGETAFEGAMRETEEETSIRVNESWLTSEARKGLKSSDAVNAYFLLQPPANLMMDMLQSDSFWNERGF